MAQLRKTKAIAQRIDPTYFKRWHRLRRARFFLSAGLTLAAGIWVAVMAAAGEQRAYANGPISPSHRMFERDCAKCHTVRFDSVHDAACVSCHDDMGAHVPLDKGRDPACATCHAEHRGSVALERVADAHCNQCHEHHATIQSLPTHAEFTPPEQVQNLRFNHEKHLAADLKEGPLDCGSCHQPQPWGEDFKPIRFAAHCARCHEEVLGAGSDAKVPHGLQQRPLRDWVTAEVLAGLKREGLAGARESVPGRGRTPPTWLGELDRLTDRAMEVLLPNGQTRGCLICHVRDGDRIAVPSVPSNWLPRARFDHNSHRTESCDRCHDLAGSRTAEDLRLPGVAICRECHSDQGARATCVTCHPYHPARHEAAWRR